MISHKTQDKPVYKIHWKTHGLETVLFNPEWAYKMYTHIPSIKLIENSQVNL